MPGSEFGLANSASELQPNLHLCPARRYIAVSAAATLSHQSWPIGREDRMPCSLIRPNSDASYNLSGQALGVLRDQPSFLCPLTCAKPKCLEARQRAGSTCKRSRRRARIFVLPRRTAVRMDLTIK